jgi:hypothetical protein
VAVLVAKHSEHVLCLKQVAVLANKLAVEPLGTREIAALMRAVGRYNRRMANIDRFPQEFVTL